MSTEKDKNRLSKNLKLFDVYAIATGAMFSSGFFLLPGLAAAKAGPSVVLAYLCAGVLIMPAMFSAAELSTALPRAGGAYYFLDRALGPMFGTVGGLGTYMALALKTAFALIGIGAYASIFFDIPIKPVAIFLTLVFVIVNIVGAKESAGLQKILVVILLVVLALFLCQGTFQVAGKTELIGERFSDFLPHGFAGFISTIGFVFVSYAGLTKVASVAEEVENPERNIPLGMLISLASTTFIYVVGVFVVLVLIEPAKLHSDLTPIATAAEQFVTPIPKQALVALVSIAALAAFASTGNAGVLASSRYPFAMARDKLLPERFATVGKYKTPTPAILATGAFIIGFIVLLNAEGIAKLASAFQLLIFMLVNFAVIVMRESRIQSYDPGYKSPLYPWMQVAGMVFSLLLILYMGWLAIGFTIGIVAFCLAWYFKYARNRVERDGAIFHWFQLLGQRKYHELDHEFRGILKEKGLREQDPFHEVVGRAEVIEIPEGDGFENVVEKASAIFSERLGVDAEKLRSQFMEGTRTGATPVSHGAALPHLHLIGVSQPELVIARSRAGISLEVVDILGDELHQHTYAIFLLVSPEENPSQHLRMLAELANKIDDDNFIENWQDAPNPAHLKRLLLDDGRFLSIRIKADDKTSQFINKSIMDIRIPEGCLVAAVQREEEVIIPRGKTILEQGDRLVVIGEESALDEFKSTYI